MFFGLFIIIFQISGMILGGAGWFSMKICPRTKNTTAKGKWFPQIITGGNLVFRRQLTLFDRGAWEGAPDPRLLVRTYLRLSSYPRIVAPGPSYRGPRTTKKHEILEPAAFWGIILFMIWCDVLLFFEFWFVALRAPYREVRFWCGGHPGHKIILWVAIGWPTT